MSLCKMLTLLIVIITISRSADSIRIDNSLIGDPVVNCEDTMVSLTFETEKPFTGRIYARGLSDDDRCSRNFAVNVDQTQFHMMVPTGECGMQRQRSEGQLEGTMFSLVIVVSFHGTFVTKADRAYRCMCFFRNIKRLTHMIDMSTLGVTDLIDTAKTPTCKYTLREGSPDGEEMRYAKVGDEIHHRWECDDENQGFLVHSCWVNDGRGNRFDFYDIDGCAVDPIIMPDIKYTSDLGMAHVETHGFKFSDSSVLNFQCVVELCKKAAGECEQLPTPPQCGSRARRALGVHQDKDSMAFDLIVSVDVLESFEEDLDEPPPPKRFFERRTLSPPETANDARTETCLANENYIFMLVSLIVACLSSATLAFMLFLQQCGCRRKKLVII